MERLLFFLLVEITNFLSSERLRAAYFAVSFRGKSVQGTPPFGKP
jgi:hypothetical protein